MIWRGRTEVVKHCLYPLSLARCELEHRTLTIRPTFGSRSIQVSGAVEYEIPPRITSVWRIAKAVQRFFRRGGTSDLNTRNIRFCRSAAISYRTELNRA